MMGPRKEDEDTRTFAKPDVREVTPGERDRACLIVIRGLNVGDMYKLGRAQMILGRGRHADVEILDDSISRRHASVTFAGDRVELSDLGSRNGTFLNGRRLEGPAELHDGDKIQLSSTTILKFAYADRLDESFQRRMYESSLRDGLTKTFNRKYFLDRLERELRFAKRHRQPLALILIDIDGFKALNEARGHIAGDIVLGEVAGELHRAIRSEDVLARHGGDELAIVCRATDAAGATTFAERLRSAVAALHVVHEGTPVAVTVSIGVAGLSPQHTDSMALLAAADGALAAAKHAGGNRVQVAAETA